KRRLVDPFRSEVVVPGQVELLRRGQLAVIHLDFVTLSSRVTCSARPDNHNEKRQTENAERETRHECDQGWENDKRRSSDPLQKLQSFFRRATKRGQSLMASALYSAATW